MERVTDRRSLTDIDGQNEEEGNPSSPGSPWTPPVIGWCPEDRRDAGRGHGSLRFLAV